MSIGDRMVYFVICSAKDGTEYIVERETSDLDRATTVKDIADGQIENLVQVIECNPVEATSRDVTEDVCRDVMNIWAHSGEPLSFSQYEFIELHIGTRAARSFLREVA